MTPERIIERPKSPGQVVRRRKRRGADSLRDTSRVQGFSDAVFALSATLLVVTLEVPRSYDELIHVLGGFPAFALAFAAVLSLWDNHRQFFARYGVADGWIVAINSVLLFVVLLYVYPLKLLAEVVAESFLGVAPNVTVGMGPAEIQGLYVIFGLAIVGTIGLMLALHLRVWYLRAELGLEAATCRALRREINVYGLVGGVTVVATTVAALGIGLTWGLPLLLILSSPVIVIVEGVAHRVRQNALVGTAQPADSTSDESAATPLQSPISPESPQP